MTIKLLIVDDSALMRRQLTQVFEAEGDFELRLARNGQEAIDENLAFKPDVLTLDVNMPTMDGLTALSHIMTSRPVAVVMVSSLTEKGALATFEALALGAVDYIAKPDGTISLSIDRIKEDLVRKVRIAARARPRAAGPTSLGARSPRPRAATANAKAPPPPASGAGAEGIVVIGVSTGGPSTLEEILPLLAGDFPFPVIVAQHMPASFTGPFASRLNDRCALQVIEVTRPMEARAGTIHIARGGADLVVAVRGGKLMVVPKPEAPQFLWHPSVELLGRSVLEHCEAEHVIAVMLTGMGNDGAEAFAEIRRRGGRTIAESESSCVVFGMPKELIDRGGASLVLPAGQIATQLAGWAR